MACAWSLLAPTLAIVHACSTGLLRAAGLHHLLHFSGTAGPLGSIPRRTSCATASSLSVDDGGALRANRLRSHLAAYGSSPGCTPGAGGVGGLLGDRLNMYIWRSHGEEDTIVHPVLLLSALLLAQLSLGLGAYLVRYTAMAALATAALRVGLTTTHLAVGSLLLATSMVLTLRTYRLGTAPTPMIARTLLPEQVSL